MPWLLRLREALSIPMVYVTHSVDEMTRLGDHLVVLDQGKVMAHGPLSETLVSLPAPLLPEHEQGALLNGHVLGFDTAWHLARIDLASDTLWVSDQGLTPGQPVRVRLLARDISLVTAAPTQTSIQNHWPVQIQAVVDLDHPSQRLLRLAHPAGTLLARITHRAWNQLGLKVGQRVWAQVKSVAVVR
jgi:molybdate transport system ATP-binding protein